MPEHFKNWAEARDAFRHIVDSACERGFNCPTEGPRIASEVEDAIARIPADSPEPNCPATPDGSDAGLREAVKRLAQQRRAQAHSMASGAARAEVEQIARDLDHALAQHPREDADPLVGMGDGLVIRRSVLQAALDRHGATQPEAPAAPEPDPYEDDPGEWQCSACGDAYNGMSALWRHGPKGPEHRCEGLHPQCGYFSARYIGPGTRADALKRMGSRFAGLLAAARQPDAPEVKP